MFGFDRGDNQGILSVDIAVGMRDPDTRQYIKALIEKSEWKVSIKPIIESQGREFAEG